MLPSRRLQAVRPQEGEFVRPSPDSAAVWCYTGKDWNGDGKLAFHEQMHRTIGTPVISDNLLVLADLSGVVHCIDVDTGKSYWTCDLMANVWASPLVAGDCVYVADTSGIVSIFHLSRAPAEAMAHRDGEWKPRYQIDMGDPIHATPVAVGDVLYIATHRRLYAISAPAIEKERWYAQLFPGSEMFQSAAQFRAYVEQADVIGAGVLQEWDGQRGTVQVESFLTGTLEGKSRSLISLIYTGGFLQAAVDDKVLFLATREDGEFSLLSFCAASDLYRYSEDLATFLRRYAKGESRETAKDPRASRPPGG